MPLGPDAMAASNAAWASTQSERSSASRAAASIWSCTAQMIVGGHTLRLPTRADNWREPGTIIDPRFRGGPRTRPIGSLVETHPRPSRSSDDGEPQTESADDPRLRAGTSARAVDPAQPDATARWGAPGGTRRRW